MAGAPWSLGQHGGSAGKVAPPPVRHALGYEFVAFAARYGTSAGSLFDFWALAHFIRAHRGSFKLDPGLTNSAVVFLGNVCIPNHPECYWTGNGPYLAGESAQEVLDDRHTLLPHSCSRAARGCSAPPRGLHHRSGHGQW